MGEACKAGGKEQLPAGVVILFRQLNEPVAPWSIAGIRWVVELWVPDMAYPVGQAWVMDCGDTGGIVYLDWLQVEDASRRQGVATRLLDAAIGRWPTLMYDGASDSGDAFVAAYDGTD